MREEEGRTALCSMADAPTAVRPRAVQSDGGRARLPNGVVGRRGRLIGRPAGVTARSDGPRRPSAQLGGRWEIFTVRPIGSPSPRADGRNAVEFLGRDRQIGWRHL